MQVSGLTRKAAAGAPFGHAVVPCTSLKSSPRLRQLHTMEHHDISANRTYNSSNSPKQIAVLEPPPDRIQVQNSVLDASSLLAKMKGRVAKLNALEKSVDGLFNQYQNLKQQVDTMLANPSYHFNLADPCGRWQKLYTCRKRLADLERDLVVRQLLIQQIREQPQMSKYSMNDPCLQREATRLLHGRNCVALHQVDDVSVHEPSVPEILAMKYALSAASQTALSLA